MEEKLDRLLENMNEMQKGLIAIQQMNLLKLTKVEYELMVLKNIVFKIKADEKGVEHKEIESMFESMVHVAILANYNNIKKMLSELDETLIKNQLGLDE